MKEKKSHITPTKHLPSISHTCNHRCYATVSGGHPSASRAAAVNPSLCHLCADTHERQLLESITTKSSHSEGKPSPQERNTLACHLLHHLLIFILTFVVSQLPAKGAQSIPAVTMVTWILNYISTSW